MHVEGKLIHLYETKAQVVKPIDVLYLREQALEGAVEVVVWPLLLLMPHCCLCN